MNIQQIEKLKGLIGSSTILTQYERVEWLSLLELMNDKQLMELEKILGNAIVTSDKLQVTSKGTGNTLVNPQSAISSQVTSPRLPSPEGSANGGQASPFSARRGMDAGSTKDITKSEPAKQPPVTPMPKLSHIMNLPHIGGMPASQLVTRLPSPAAQSVGGQGPSVSQKKIETVVEKKKSGFANKLKAIFAEKELPAGRAHEPLELTAGQPVSGSANQLVGKPVNKESSMVHLAMKPDAPAEASKIAKPTTPLPPKVPVPPVKTVIQPVIIPVVAPIKMADLPPVVLKQVIKPREDVQEEVLTLLKHKKPKTDPDFNPGVNFEKTTEQSRTENLDKIKLHMAATGSAKGVAELGKDPSISNLKDLTQINLAILKESSETGFVNKIKQLIAKFGYFQVLFNIEESPAYKAYIATGLKLLTDGNNFDQLEQGGGVEKFLDKDSFEKFADVLAKIQSS